MAKASQSIYTGGSLFHCKINLYCLGISVCVHKREREIERPSALSPRTLECTSIDPASCRIVLAVMWKYWIALYPVDQRSWFDRPPQLPQSTVNFKMMALQMDLKKHCSRFFFSNQFYIQLFFFANFSCHIRFSCNRENSHFSCKK